MAKKEELEDLFARHGSTDFKWLKSKDVKTAQWVRLRCMFGCPAHGVKATCPPNVPSIEQCREIFSEYEDSDLPFPKGLPGPGRARPLGQGNQTKAPEAGREVFLSGYYKVFLISFGFCDECEECVGNLMECKNKRSARPGADAMGIDVYATARGAGYPIKVLRDYNETMNRYAFLLVE